MFDLTPSRRETQKSFAKYYVRIRTGYGKCMYVLEGIKTVRMVKEV